MKISFGGLTLDTDTRQLRRGGAEVHLSPKAFDLLTLLVEKRPKAFSKADLQERLWPATYVSETNLSGLVAEIRRALGDDARAPRFVRTVNRYGYAFAGEVGRASKERAPDSASCCLIWGERQVPLVEGENILGRDPDTGGFDSITVSRNHARIVITRDGATIEDIGSKNGTFLRGNRVTSSQSLADGDAIGLGSLVMTFRISSTGRSTRTWRK